MAIASFQFLAFAFLVVVVYNLGQPTAWRQTVFLVANLCFLATFSLSFASYLPFVAFLILGYVGMRLMQNHRTRAGFVPLLIVVILVFIWLKKYSFLPASTFIRHPYITIGLSYIFFRALHLIIDAREENLPGQVSLIAYLNYTLNFTTLVSGPIQWYHEFAEMQLVPERPSLDIIKIGRSIERIVIGFFKVNVLSLLLSVSQRQELSVLSSLEFFWPKVATGIVIAVAYPIYLYFNFSGYTDIVIGVAGLLRLRLPENFNRPFSSLNFIDFWGRWHITLSAWLKTYVYNSLIKVLMKKFPSTKIEPFLGVFAFFVTFFLIGVWHGQTSEFIVYGILLGLGVAVNKLYQVVMMKAWGRKEYKKLAGNPTYRAFARGLTFSWFTLSLFWFWSNWNQMASMKRAMGGGAIAVTWAAIFFGATVVLAVYEAVRAWVLSFEWEGQPLVLSRYVRTVWNTALATISIVVMLILNAPAPEIVYKAF